MFTVSYDTMLDKNTVFTMTLVSTMFTMALFFLHNVQNFVVHNVYNDLVNLQVREARARYEEENRQELAAPANHVAHGCCTCRLCMPPWILNN